MSRLRLVLAWLLMAALPFQGMAAASMLFCGSQAPARAAQAAEGAVHAGHHAGTDMSSHDHGSQRHASHGHRSDHAFHGHAAAHGGPDPAANHAPGAAGDATQSHTCPICASCSQAQAVGGFDPLPVVSAVPSAEPSQPPIRVSSRTLSLPDKPPRA